LILHKLPIKLGKKYSTVALQNNKFKTAYKLNDKIDYLKNNFTS